MFTIAKNSNKIAYGIKHFVVDTEAELEEIPLISVFSGSTAFVVEKSARYMLNNKREWIKVSTASSGGSSGGSGNPVFLTLKAEALLMVAKLTMTVLQMVQMMILLLMAEK